MKKSKNDLVVREIFSEIKRWLNEKEILIIDGSRQVGKTTLLFQIREILIKKNVVYVNFEELETLENFLHSPKDFVRLQLSENKKNFFLFDEFQYVNQAGKVLKILYDSFPEVKFIISGSSSLKIRQIASYLVGRAVFFELYPFSFAEYLSYKDKKLFILWQENHKVFEDFIKDKKISFIKKIFIYEKELRGMLEKYTVFGGYPAIATSNLNLIVRRLKNIIETYIEKDIVKFLKIGNFLEFKNLVKNLSIQIGNLLNYSNLANDLKLGRGEILKFISILENTFIINLIKPFSTHKITEIKKTPKIYFYDLGLRNALISDFRSLDQRREKGALIENFVFQNLKYRDFQLNFWRTKQQAEVDFVINYEREIIPIEVKDKEINQPQITRSFVSFLERYNPKKGVILTRGFFGIKKFKETKVLFLPYCFV